MKRIEHLLDTTLSPQLVTFPPSKSSRNDDEYSAIVLNWPDYSKGNPYQYLLYRRNEYGVRSYFGKIEQAIELLEQNLSAVPVVFHLHWLTWLFKGVTDPYEAHQRAFVFASQLARFKRRGGRLLWTIHNEISHESDHMEAEKLLSSQVAELADSIHIHDYQSLDEINEYDIPRHKVVEFPHGHYLGVYSDFITRKESRSILGLSDDDDVCLFLGQVRKYKGVDELVTAFRAVRQERPKLKLLIVGSSHYDPLASQDVPLSADEKRAILMHGNFLEPNQLQIFYRAADFSVLPYRKVLTSGSLMLSLSFRTPVAVSENAMIRNVIEGGEYGTFIPTPPTADHIRDAMRELLARKDSGTLAMDDRTAARFAEQHKWRDFTLEVIKPIAEERRERPPIYDRVKAPPLARRVAVDDYALLTGSEHFNPEEFAQRCPSSCAAARDPAAAYLEAAANAGCRPNAWFDPAFYTGFFPDAAIEPGEPFLHYLKFGIGRRPANAEEQRDMLGRFCAETIPGLDVTTDDIRVCLFCSAPALPLDGCRHVIATAMEASPAVRIDLVLGANPEFEAALERQFSSEIQSGRLALHTDRIYRESPLFYAVSIARKHRTGTPIVFVDARGGDADAGPAIRQAKAAGTQGPLVFLAGPEDPNGHVFTIQAGLLDRYAPEYRPLNDADLPYIIAAKVRQACMAVPILGPPGRDPEFGLPQITRWSLRQAEVAHADGSAQRMPFVVTGEDEAQSLFDLTDSLIDGTTDKTARAGLKNENLRAKAAYVSLHREHDRLERHFELMSGPANGPAEGASDGGPVVITCVKNDHLFLPTFIDHYRRLGAARIVIIDDQSDRGVHLDHSADDISVLRPKFGRFFTSKTLWLELLIRHYVRPGNWVVTADADEFLDLPTGYSGLPDLVESMKRDGRFYMLCLLLDMLPEDGRTLSTDAAFETALDHVSWNANPVEEAYRRNGTTRWGFGPFAQLSWQIDARYHLFGVHESLRKLTLFEHRDGLHLNQGFHSLVDRFGRTLIAGEAWEDGPIGLLRHYKFIKFLSSRDPVRDDALEGVYFEQTAKNHAKIFGKDPDEIAEKIGKSERLRYSATDMTALVDQLRGVR